MVLRFLPVLWTCCPGRHCPQGLSDLGVTTYMGMGPDGLVIERGGPGGPGGPDLALTGNHLCIDTVWRAIVSLHTVY